MTESLAPSQINGNFIMHSGGPRSKRGKSKLVAWKNVPNKYILQSLQQIVVVVVVVLF